MIVLVVVRPAGGAEPGDIVVNSVGMKLAYIPPGTFTMGSPETEPGRISQRDAAPSHIRERISNRRKRSDSEAVAADHGNEP